MTVLAVIFECFGKKGQVNLLIIGLFDAAESIFEALGGQQNVVIFPEIRIIKISQLPRQGVVMAEGIVSVGTNSLRLDVGNQHLGIGLIMGGETTFLPVAIEHIGHAKVTQITGPSL